MNNRCLSRYICFNCQKRLRNMANAKDTMKIDSKDVEDCDFKECMGKFLMQEIKGLVREAAKQVLDENEVIEELQCKVKNYEEHIACLEQMVEQLQLIIRSQLESEGLTDDGSSSSGEAAKKVQTEKKTTSLLDWLRSNPAPAPITPIPNNQTSKSRIEYKQTKKAQPSTSSQGSLDDFL